MLDISLESLHLLKRLFGNFSNILRGISNTFPDTLIRMVPACWGGLSNRAASWGDRFGFLAGLFPELLVVEVRDLMEASDHFLEISCKRCGLSKSDG